MSKSVLYGLALVWFAVGLPRTAAAQKGSPEGYWWTRSKTVKIQIYRTTSGTLAGKIVWLRDGKDAHGKPLTDHLNPDCNLRSRPVLGMVVLRGLKQEDADTWTGGTIYDPKHGNSYSCKLEVVSPNSLELRGYKGITLLGKSTALTRAQ